MIVTMIVTTSVFLIVFFLGVLAGIVVERTRVWWGRCEYERK